MTTASSVKLSALISDPDYSGTYEVRVYRGTTNGKAIEHVATKELVADGWLTMDLDIAAESTSVVYLEVFEVDANRMAWTAPVWVDAI